MDEAAQNVNYIAEINAFQELAPRLGLSPYARVLWFTLMDINNRAGWKKEFTVPLSLLMSNTGIGKTTLRKARDELAAGGFISYVPGVGSHAPVYRINSLEVATRTPEVAMRTPEVATRTPEVATRTPEVATRTPGAAGGRETDPWVSPRGPYLNSKPLTLTPSSESEGTRERERVTNQIDYIHIAAKNENSAPDELDALFDALSLTSPALKKNVRAWLVVRARRGAPVTGYPLELLMANLKKNADGDEEVMNEMVEEAVSNGWLQAYRHDRRAPRQQAASRHTMTEEERRKAFDEQAKRGGW